MPKERFSSLTVRDDCVEPLKVIYKKMILDEKTKETLQDILKVLPDLKL